MRVTTESGTVYEFDSERTRVRRVTDAGGDQLREDGVWLSVALAGEVRRGIPMVLFLEPLGEGNVTIRTTSPVVSIEEDGN